MKHEQNAGTKYSVQQLKVTQSTFSDEPVC